MQTGYSKTEKGFWIRWVIATTASSCLGGAVSGAVVFSGETRFTDVTSPLIGAVALGLTNVVAFGLHGAAMGIGQWSALRTLLPWGGWWAVATAGGWALAGMVSGVLAGAFGGGITGVGPSAGPVGMAVTVVGGMAAVLLAPGLSQWLVLRRWVERAGRWVAARAGSFVVATGFSFPVMVAVARATGWNLPSAQAWGLNGALTGAIEGCLTGAVLIWLLRRGGARRLPGEEVPSKAGQVE